MIIVFKGKRLYIFLSLGPIIREIYSFKFIENSCIWLVRLDTSVSQIYYLFNEPKDTNFSYNMAHRK